MKYLIIAFFFLSNLGFQNSSFAQDAEGSEDHPLLSRYPGSEIASYEKIKYREYSFAKGPVTAYKFIEDKELIAGQLYRITYTIEKDVEDLSIGEVYQDYLEAFKKGGIDILAKGLFSDRNVKKQVGGSSWIGVALMDNGFTQKSAANLLFKGTSSSGGTFGIIGEVRRTDGISNIAMYGERHSNKKVVVHVDIIEQKAAETGFVFADAAYMKNEIDEKGMVIIYGINFDFDSDAIKEDSKPVIDEIATYLKENPDVSIYIVGHTDMKGALGYNIGLSERRATALVNKLSEDYEIKKSRMLPDGVGPLAPVATNDTEEGRALNRRVELVKQMK